MNASRRIRRIALGTAMVALAVGCGGSSGQSGTAFIFLSVDGFLPALATSPLGDRSASTLVCVTIRNNLKNPTVTSPSTLDNVVIESYTVSITRLDGGPAPPAFTLNTAAIVPAGTFSGTDSVLGGNTASFLVIVVPAQLKNEPPLSPAPALPLNATAEVIFRGRDGRGQRVETRGSVNLLFVASGTEATPTCPTGGTYGASLLGPVRPAYALLSLSLIVGLVTSQLAALGAQRRRTRSGPRPTLRGGTGGTGRPD